MTNQISINIFPDKISKKYIINSFLFLFFAVLTEDENSPNDNSSRGGGGAANTTDYATNDSELVKSESGGGNSNATPNASNDPLSLAAASAAGGGGEANMERSASGTASAAAQSADGYAMQRYNTNYDTNYAANYSTIQSYYGATGAASTPGMYPMTPLGAPFLYPHLYSAGHHATGLHHGQETGLVDEYVTAGNPEVSRAGGGDLQDQAGQHTAYSQLGGEDESQTGPIRGGYLKSEHGVWRPY